MIDPLTIRWAVYDSWVVFPDHVDCIKRSISVVPEGRLTDTVCAIGNLHPAATDRQAAALALAQHIVDQHNAALAA